MSNFSCVLHVVLYSISQQMWQTENAILTLSFVTSSPRYPELFRWSLGSSRKWASTVFYIEKVERLIPLEV